jgi:hypothetical protein
MKHPHVVEAKLNTKTCPSEFSNQNNNLFLRDIYFSFRFPSYPLYRLDIYWQSILFYNHSVVKNKYICSKDDKYVKQYFNPTDLRQG